MGSSNTTKPSTSDTRKQQCTRYLPMVRELALRALSMAVDASPHEPRPREGERIISLAQLLPLAHAIIENQQDLPAPETATSTDTIRWVDGIGHFRPAYGLLASRMLRRARRTVPDCITATEQRDTPIEELWQPALDADKPSAPIPHFDLNVSPKPLFPQQPDDSPDDWTYRELVGLHGLVAAARASADPQQATRAYRVALYHVQHTQPDYTTYQPWALAWFLNHPDTLVMGEQQLHDVATHLSLEGRPGALVPAILMVDAWADLAHDLETCS